MCLVPKFIFTSVEKIEAEINKIGSPRDQNMIFCNQPYDLEAIENLKKDKGQIAVYVLSHYINEDNDLERIE